MSVSLLLPSHQVGKLDSEDDSVSGTIRCQFIVMGTIRCQFMVIRIIRCQFIVIASLGDNWVLVHRYCFPGDN